MKAILWGATAALLATAAWGQQPRQSTQVIEMRPGAQLVVKMPKPISSVSVGDPDAVDVLPRSDNILVIQARKPGSSDIIAFSDAEPIYHVTVSVGQSRSTTKVISHGKKDLQHYTAYECNPVCTRADDKHEGAPAPVFILPGGGAAAGASSTMNIIVPPAAPTR